MPSCLGACVVGAHQDEHPVGKLRAARPDLLAVDEKVIALVLGPGAQARQVAASPRLAVALAPRHFGAGNARQMGLFLFFGTELEKRRSEHADAETGQRGSCPDSLHFLNQDEVFVPFQSAAAVFLWPGGGGPAFLDHAVEPDPGIGVGDFDLAASYRNRPWPPGAGRTVGCKPGPGIRPEFRQVHQWFLPRCCAPVRRDTAF